MGAEKSAKYAWKIFFLLVLVALLLGILTWTGIMKCKTIPGWCDVYYGITRFAFGGQARVAIVFGFDGLGEPQILEQLLADPGFLGVQATMIPLEHLELGNIRDYDLVIVERAKTMETKKMQIFIDYVFKHGGRLVWTGDAGSTPTSNDKLLYFEQRQGKAICEDVIGREGLTSEDINKLNLDCVLRKDASTVGPWARVREDNSILNFDQFLGLNYHGNFCFLTAPLAITPQERQRIAANCFAQKRLVGKLLPEPTLRHPLIKGLRTDLGMFGDFAIVEEVGGGFSTRALSVRFDGNISVINEKGKSRDLGNIIPMIQTAGVGERIAYYALPPEMFALQPMGYISIVENMYIGMVKG